MLSISTCMCGYVQGQSKKGNELFVRQNQMTIQEKPEKLGKGACPSGWYCKGPSKKGKWSFFHNKWPTNEVNDLIL